MDDRVAEVLAERAALDRSVSSGLALSLLLHGALSGVAVYAAFHEAPPRAVTAVNIQFAKLPGVAAEVKPAAPIPRIEEPKPEPKKEEPKAPPEKKTVPISPFGRSTKKGSENPETKPSTVNRQPATEVPVGQTGVTGLEGGDFPYPLYIERMKTLIGSHWFRPEVPAGATVIVHFVIERDGTIRDAKYQTASGLGTFDRAALRAVLEASPLPPLPFGYAGTYLGVHLTFR